MVIPSLASTPYMLVHTYTHTSESKQPSFTFPFPQKIMPCLKAGSKRHPLYGPVDDISDRKALGASQDSDGTMIMESNNAR